MTAREFVFTEHDFEHVRALIGRHAGIHLNDSKHDLVYGRLARRLRATGIDSFRHYLERLERDAQELEAFINALTTNMTGFFREPHHFDLLAQQLRANGAARPIRIWTSACASGEEAYSIAMTVCEALGEGARVEILASDLDSHMLEVARQGRYPAAEVEKLGAARKARFFEPDGEGWWKAKTELRRLLRFDRINLMDRSYPIPVPCDAIFCRNVMIYFQRDTQRTVLEKYRPLLSPDGRLYMGHAEHLHFAADLFHPLGQTVYAPLGEPRA